MRRLLANRDARLLLAAMAAVVALAAIYLLTRHDQVPIR